MPDDPSVAPFRLTPDIKFVFESQVYVVAAAGLREAIDSGKRLIALVGEAGTGKTTLLTRLRSDVRCAERTIVYCPYPALSIGALLQDFVGEADAATGEPVASPEAIARHIAARHRGRRLLLIVDDSTRCPPRLLTDLWRVAEDLTKASATLQVILAASPTFCQELDRILTGAGMPGAAHVELPPMDVADVAAYVRHRMAVAGRPGDVFSADAFAEIAQYSLGVARVVNQICSRALMLSDWRRERPISRRLVVEAITDCPIDALVAPRAAGEVSFGAGTAAEASAAAPAITDAPVAVEPVAIEPVVDEPATDEPAIPATAAEASPGPVRPEIVAQIEIDVPAAPATAAAEPVPEPARAESFPSAELDVPAPPSAAPYAAGTAAGRESPVPATASPPVAAPRLVAASTDVAGRPVGRDSWALREAARRRGRRRGDQLRPQGDGADAPRFSGFVARRSAPPAAKSIASPGPIAPAPLPPRPPKLRFLAAAVVVLVAISVAVFLQKDELVIRIGRALPPEMLGRLTQVSDQATAAVDAVLRALRSAYRQEPPPRS